MTRNCRVNCIRISQNNIYVVCIIINNKRLPLLRHSCTKQQHTTIIEISMLGIKIISRRLPIGTLSGCLKYNNVEIIILYVSNVDIGCEDNVRG